MFEKYSNKYLNESEVNEDYSQRARNFRVRLRARLETMKKGEKISYDDLSWTALGNGNFKDSRGRTVPYQDIVQDLKFAVQPDIMRHRGARGDEMIDAYLTFESVNEKLNSRERNLADVLADDVGDYLGDTLDYRDWESANKQTKAEYVNNALGKISDRYYNDGDFDKDLDKLMNRKYDEVVGYIAKQLSEGIEMIEEARGAKSTQFTKPGKDGDIYFSKREGNAVAVRKGDTLQSIYVYDGEVKLGKIHKTDKRWDNMGEPTEKLLIDLKLKNVGGLNTRDTATNDGKLIYKFLSESVNEGKMPDKYVGNDEIVYLKTKEDSKGANYNLYYKGHDIDAGGHRFGSEKELKDFAANYVLSNQLYNKLKHEKPKSLPESVNEGKYRIYMNSDADAPNEIDYEEYFGDGNKSAMIKKAKELAKDGKNQYGDPIKIAVTAEDDINDVVWTNESTNEDLLIPRFCDFVNEAKVTAKTVDKLTNQIAQLSKELKDNFALFKKAKTDEDKKKYLTIAGEKTKEKRRLDTELEKAIQNFGSDMELDMTFESEDAIKPGQKIKYKQLMGMGAKQDWVELTGVVQKVKKKRKDPFGNVNPHKEFHLRSGSIVSRFKNHKDIELNEEREFGMFNGDMGKPTKLDKEVLDIVLKALPGKITKNIKEVEGSGAYKRSAISPPTVSNKGQSRGEIEYTTIYIMLDKPMGRNKVQGITVGLRKRTSGPGTGYLYMSVSPDSHHSFGPDAEGAIEFWDDPSYFLKKLYDEKFKNWF